MSWPESLGKMLENDQNWIKIVNGKKTEILNFSRSGIGFTQFKLIALHKIKDFEPDIILVSFILDDFYRGIYKTGPAFNFQNISKNHNLILHEFIKRVWLSKKPNLIIKVSFGFFQVAPDFYSSPRSFFGSHSVRNRYHPKEAIKKSIKASIAIDSVYKCNFFIRHPTYDDFTGNSETKDSINRLINWKGSTKGLLEKYVSGLNQKGIIVNDLFEEMKVIVQKTGVEKFFNLPHDKHPNYLGAFNYAKRIKLLLIEKVEEKCNL